MKIDRRVKNMWYTYSVDKTDNNKIGVMANGYNNSYWVVDPVDNFSSSVEAAMKGYCKALNADRIDRHDLYTIINSATHLVYLDGRTIDDAFYDCGKVSKVTFTDCYFHNCTFYNVIFTTVKFINCHFDNCKFECCEFVNCEWYNLDCPVDGPEQLKFIDCCWNEECKFFGVDDSCADIADVPQYSPACSFYAWKKVYTEDDTPAIAKLWIPEEDKKVNGFSRLCRSNKALVLEIKTLDGEDVEETCHSYSDRNYYRVGRVTFAANYNDSYLISYIYDGGIYYYIDRNEAVRE
jgi:hypothetical protein